MYKCITDAWCWKCFVHSTRKKNSELQTNTQLVSSWNLEMGQGKNSKADLITNNDIIIIT